MRHSRHCGPRHGGPAHFDPREDWSMHGHRGGYRRGGPPGFGPRGRRARRGAVKAAVLVLLDEEPRNGYALIQEIEARSEGAWRPSPGSIYPALAMMEDEGLIRSVEADDQRAYELTDKGREQLAQRGEDAPAPWEPARSDAGRRHRRAVQDDAPGLHGVASDHRGRHARADQAGRAGPGPDPADPVRAAGGGPRGRVNGNPPRACARGALLYLHPMPRGRIRSSLAAVVAATTLLLLIPTAGQAQSTTRTACPGTFQVLHNDSIGTLRLSAGAYQITVANPAALSCARAAQDLAEFLQDYDGKLRRPWNVNTRAVAFQRGSDGQVSFSLARVGSATPGGGGSVVPTPDGQRVPGLLRRAAQRPHRLARDPQGRVPDHPAQPVAAGLRERVAPVHLLPPGLRRHACPRRGS